MLDQSVPKDFMYFYFFTINLLNLLKIIHEPKLCMPLIKHHLILCSVADSKNTFLMTLVLLKSHFFLSDFKVYF